MTAAASIFETSENLSASDDDASSRRVTSTRGTAGVTTPAVRTGPAGGNGSVDCRVRGRLAPMRPRVFFRSWEHLDRRRRGHCASRRAGGSARATTCTSGRAVDDAWSRRARTRQAGCRRRTRIRSMHSTDGTRVFFETQEALVADGRRRRRSSTSTSAPAASTTSGLDVGARSPNQPLDASFGDASERRRAGVLPHAGAAHRRTTRTVASTSSSAPGARRRASRRAAWTTTPVRTRKFMGITPDGAARLLRYAGAAGAGGHRCAGR